ncbi:MAG: hypothetical protein SXU28_06080 [Pseudomonadota bacterium]|nr:hypothetical protein [Pseudomonadota bacterium]
MTEQTPALSDLPSGEEGDGASGSPELTVGDDEWVDLTPGPSIELGEPAEDAEAAPQSGNIPLPETGTPLWIWIALLAGLAVLALIVWLALKSRRTQNDPDEIDSGLVGGVRGRISMDREVTLGEQADLAAQDTETQAKAAPEAIPEAATPPTPAPTPAPAPAQAPAPPVMGQPPESALSSEPVRLDLSIAIGSATRSVMMFTLDCRVTIANRSARAVRALKLSGQVSCAQTAGGKPVDAGQLISEIDRIGPNQSQSVDALLQMPMTQVKAIRQGSTPIFVPLIHLTVEGNGDEAEQLTFVVGAPSESSRVKLHPIPLDTPPGSIRGLRANLVRQSADKERA